jgi:phytanoyl-CoA hydroxylase
MSLTAIGPEQIARRLYGARRIHTPLENPAAVDAAAIEAFHRDGFLAVANVFTAAEMDTAKEALRDLIMGRPFKGLEFEAGVDMSNLSAEQREIHVRKIMTIVPHEPRLANLAGHAALKQLVHRLLGNESNLIQDMALLKPPRGGREKPWHQDTAYFLYEPLEGIIGTWTALDPATPENGCMHVIPGSHRHGPQPHYHDRDCQLPDEAVDVDNVLAVPLQPGGVLLFSGLLHHGTPPNQSADRRRALQFHYASTACRPIDGNRHEELFHDHIGYGGCRDWDTNKKTRRVDELK